MTDSITRIANTALLCFACLEAVIMAFSFHRRMLESRSVRLFFSKIVVSAVCMACLAMVYLRGFTLRDPLNITLVGLSYIGIYAIYFLYIEYLKAQIEEIDREKSLSIGISYAALVICTVGSMLWILTETDAGFDRYGIVLKDIGFTLGVGNFGGLILIFMTLWILITRYKTLGARHALVLSSMPVLLLIATLADPYVHYIGLYYPAIMIEICIVYTQHHLEVEGQIERDEMAETRSKLALATGRMKPHYIYNVLTTIYYLCETDPDKAQRAIGTFSEYLRNTLEVMERQEPVTFARELNEIRHYLELEKLRFGDRLTVEYDVEYDEFLVPPLSIQPLVENAVKHGIAAKEEGGTVRIVSRKLSDGGAQIRIIDNGIGFDIDSLKNLDVTHEGLANVRERIRLEVGGDMTITSVPGRMTTVVVTIRPGNDSRK